MWLVAFRDLQWRRRRFVAAVGAVGIVFALTLLLDGFTASLHDEAQRTATAHAGVDSVVTSCSLREFRTRAGTTRRALDLPERTRA
jgi:hypothetical protein